VRLHREVELAPSSFFTFHPDTPAHQLHEPFRNRKSQPGAAIAPRGGHIGLCERLKNRLSFFLRYSDAGVYHRELQHQTIFRIPGVPAVNGHLPLVCEFQGVSR